MGGNMQMQQIMRQAQKMQQQMEKTQEEIDAMEFEGTAGGGMCTVKMNGKKEVLSVTLKPEVVDPEDIDMLQDLIAAAVNEAIQAVSAYTEQKMGAFTGGAGRIPGLF